MLIYLPQNKPIDPTGYLNQAWRQWFMNPTFQSATFADPIGYESGGTGLSATPGSGQLLVGTGTGYQLSSTLPISALPEFLGDATAPGASNELTLADVNTAPGDYTRADITVNAKGLVTQAQNGNDAAASLILAAQIFGA